MTPEIMEAYGKQSHVANTVISMVTVAQTYKHSEGKLAIHHELGRKICGRRDTWNAVVKTGIQREFIRRDGSYQVGNSSMSYWLHERWTGREWIKLINNEWDRRRLTDLKRQLNGELPEHCRQLCGNLSRFTIDSDKARALVNKRLEGKARYQTLLAIEAIHDHDFYLTRDNYGRVHTNFTNLLKSVRDLGQFDSEKQIQFDISCCQPTLLGYLVVLENAGVFSLEEIEMIFSPSCTEEKNPGTLLLPHSIPMLPHYGQRCPDYIMPARVKDWVEKCQAGTIRDRLRVIWNYTDTEDKLKKALCVYMFGEHYNNGRREAIAREWFEVDDFLDRFKNQFGYWRMAQCLQRFESYLMIDCICPRLFREYPGIPLITVHDAIITTRRYGVVLQVIQEEFGKLGLHPRVK